MAGRKKERKVSMTLISIIILIIIVIVLISGIETKPRCGNNKCEAGETCISCSQDCGSCSITTTTVKTTTTKTSITTLLPTTTISKCSSNSDCMWCGTDCILKPNDIPCIALAPPEGYSCECVNGMCTKVKVSNTTTMPDNCTDTDGGIKYNIKGTVSRYFLGKLYSYTDFCTSDFLTEYYCSGTQYWRVYYNCAHFGKKCIDGACV